MWYLINFSNLFLFLLSVPIFLFLYLSFIYYLNIWKDLLFFQLSKNLVDKKGLVVETSLDLIYILPYYFSLVHVIYNFYLSICLIISIPYPNQVYDKQRKKYFSVVICVCCIMSCSEIFFPKMVLSSVLQVTPKKIFLSPTNHGNDLM